jgi:hypothetical protein
LDNLLRNEIFVVFAKGDTGVFLHEMTSINAVIISSYNIYWYRSTGKVTEIFQQFQREQPQCQAQTFYKTPTKGTLHMSRKRQSPFEDLIDIAGKLPWKISGVLAVVSYLVLHGVAGSKPANPAGNS